MIWPLYNSEPVDGLSVAMNVNSLFDPKGIRAVSTPIIPTGGIGGTTVINGRTISASGRFDF